ncbi:MAG: hypothetical protein NVS2B16_04170 [Chloroflexota bacterium]
MIQARRLLLGERELALALGPRLLGAAEDTTLEAPVIGDVLRAVALDSAYRRYRGRVMVQDAERPVTISMLALVFDAATTAQRTFSNVAQAAHLRTQLDDVGVAVETVTAPSGLVSYWGYMHRDETIIILTLDTIDPGDISVADLRSLLTVAVQRLEQVRGSGNGAAGPLS